MKQIQTRHKTENRKRATGNRKPLAEGIIPLDKRGRRSWSSVADEALVSYAKSFMKENGIRGRKELRRADRGLYYALGKKGLLDRVGFEEKRRPWKKMVDDKLINHAKKFMEEKGITRRAELQKSDHGLYWILRKRGLLDKVGFEEKEWKVRSWKDMNDDKIIEYSRKFRKENEISGRWELEKADHGLYAVLWKRRLLDRVGFEKKRPKGRPWTQMKDEEIVEHAKTLMKENEICGRNVFRKADPGLYRILWRRKLLNLVFSPIQSEPERAIEQIIDFTAEFGDRKQRTGNRTPLAEGTRMRRPYGFFSRMNDEELVSYGKTFMKENGISGRKELKKADQGLYNVLGKRKLSDKIGFEKKREKKRPWKDLKDEEILRHAKRFMKEKEISERSELRKADTGLYQILKKRGLLERLVAGRKQRKGRPWKEMKDEELIEHAKRFMKEKEISGRSKLRKADHGLYSVLYKRKLLDQVFSDIEQSKQQEFKQQLLVGLAQAADAMERFGERG